MDINRTVRVTLDVDDIKNLLAGNTVLGEGVEIDFHQSWNDRGDYILKKKDCAKNDEQCSCGLCF